MAYSPTIWANDPETSSPINADNLNKIENELLKVDGITSNLGKTNLITPMYKTEIVRGNPVTINGVTYNVKENGEIEVSGTASANSTYYIAQTITLDAGTYRCMIFASLPSGVTCDLCNSSGSRLQEFGNENTKKTIGAGEYILRVRVTNGTVVPGGTIVKPMFCLDEKYPGAYIQPAKYDDILIPELARESIKYVDAGFHRKINKYTEIPANTDLFTLTPGGYISGDGITTYQNCPTVNSFRLEIFQRFSSSTYFALIFDSQEGVFMSNRPASGTWHEWKQFSNLSDLDFFYEYGLFRDLSRNQTIASGTDLFTLGIGSYHGSGQGLVNCPTLSTFRLEIMYRSAASTYLALLFDSQDAIYVTNKPASGRWHSWKRLLDSSSEINTDVPLPDYYADYMPQRIAEVAALEDEISTNSDSFIFITDYHIKRNAGQSLKMISEIIQNTGITKLMFGGDAYQTVIPTETRTDDQARALAAQYVPYVYSLMQKTDVEYFGVLGNHEWNHYQSSATENLIREYEISLSGVYNYCIKRHEQYVSAMSREGNYYVDNKAKKIRYFFLQYNGESRPSDETLNWFGDELLNVPSGYYVFVFAHYAYISGTANLDTYGNRMRYLPKLTSDILQAYNTKSTFSMDFSFTVNEVTKTYNGSWNFSNADGNNVIGILSGHIHEDDALPKSVNNVLTIATTGDLHKNGSGVNYTFIDADGNVVERAEGTIYEQAFDVVHIDIENRKVYMTRFGAGLDREFDF